MRTTITMDDDLLAQVKTRAAERGTTVSKVIEDGVRESLLRRSEHERSEFRMGTFSSAFRAGVDLDDNGALLELMERGE